MSVTLDVDAARHRFMQAATLARQGQGLPGWDARIRSLAAGPQRTFVAFLATALLAKATNRNIDAFAIKPDAGKGGYSARTFCQRVLVPLARQTGVDLGATGDDPLANQPFFRYSRLDPDIKVGSKAQYQELRAALDEAQTLSENGAVRALAALIRVRSETPPTQEALNLHAPLSQVLAATAQFVTEEPEGGRRGQAMVAAALDLVFRGVKTHRVNDPSRHIAGDVHVKPNGGATHAFEVRQKNTTENQVAAFAARLPSSGVHRGAAVLLAPTQPQLDNEALRNFALGQHSVQLEVFYGVGHFLATAIGWSALPMSDAITTFIQRMVVRMREIGVSPMSIDRWTELFR